MLKVGGLRAMRRVERIIKLSGGRFLRKVGWDQCWHLLRADPRFDPWHTPWRRISRQRAGGFARHRIGEFSI